MRVPISKLQELIVRDVVIAVEQARAQLAGHKPVSITTAAPEITFNVEVYLDEGYVDGDEQVTDTAETVTEVTKGAEVSTSTKGALVSKESQTTKKGDDFTQQSFGRQTRTSVTETT